LIKQKMWCTDNTIVVKFTKKIDSEFLFYSFTNSDFNRFATITAQPLITQSTLSLFKFCFPPTQEQKQISDFLDSQTKLIDSQIQSNQKLVTLLQEKRQATINQAVTKGLDPTVPMKDSGVEWIGKIPEHWNVNKIRHIAFTKGRVGWQGLRSEEFIDEGPYLVTGTDFENGSISWEKCYHVAEWRYEQDHFIQLRNDDLLITKDGTIGKLAHINDLPGPATLNSHLLVIRPLKNDFKNRFLYWIFHSDSFTYYVNLEQTGTTFNGISEEKIDNFFIQLPQITEQKQISDYLDSQTKLIDSLITKTEQQIEKLQEFRQSLISAAVTGKIDVRN